MFKFKVNVWYLLLLFSLTLAACSQPVIARDERVTAVLEPPPASSDDIGAAALAGLEAIGWDVAGGGFTAEVEAVDGDYARVTVHSTNPPGGFTVFMMQQNGAWTVAYHGSAFNPEWIKEMGFPDSVMP